MVKLPRGPEHDRAMEKYIHRAVRSTVVYALAAYFALGLSFQVFVEERSISSALYSMFTSTECMCAVLAVSAFLKLYK